MNGISKILILAPHTDIWRIPGCGGSVVSFIRVISGKAGLLRGFLTAEESVPELTKRYFKKTEVVATGRLGIPAENLMIFTLKFAS